MHVFIIALHRPLNPTGVCRYAANLAQCLAETPNVEQVTLVVGIWQQRYFKSLFSSSKISLISINIENTALRRNIWYMFNLPKLVNDYQPDIIHMSFPFPFFHQLFPSPIVSTIHDLYPYEYPKNFGYPNVLFNRFFLKQCISNSDGLICISESTSKAMERFLPYISLNKLINVIYNCVDFDRVITCKPQELNYIDCDSFLLFVGQHRKNKNIDLLIQSYALLLTQNCLKYSTKLIIVGSPGPETENIHARVRAKSLENQIIFLSSLKDSELCWLYQNCQVFVSPSSTEGFCLPLAEACHFSCKVVCSNIPIFREIGSSDCNYFDLHEEPIKNLARAICHALDNPKCINNLSNSRFSKSQISSEYLKFYARLKK